MAENSKIEWTGSTCNLWWGCDEIQTNPLCDNCYAKAQSKRYGFDVWGMDKPRRAIKDIWGKLDRWQAKHAKQGTYELVFTMSMADIFERSMPLVNHKGELVEGSTGELRDRLLENIGYGCYPNLIFQFLTKRPQNVERMVPNDWLLQWPKNVWLGISAGDQENFDLNVPVLKKIPAPIRFVSMEPLLESVDMSNHINGLSWVIAGGESGHSARPTDPAWVHGVKDQCAEAGVPFFFKQWGEFGEGGDREGKKNSGNTLDGESYLAFPEF